MSEHEGLTWQESVLLFLAILLLIIAVILVLIFFCKETLAKYCPCCITKVKPEERTGWHHLDRFGEVKMKAAKHNLAEIRARKNPEDSVEEGSVYTNISLQVPVFEEKLNGTVKKKSVHMAAEHAEEEEQDSPKKKRKTKKKRSKPDDDLDSDPSLQGTPVRVRYDETM